MEAEYSKVLIQRDIDERLTVPEAWMDLLGRLFTNGNNEAQVRAVDCGGRFWEFCCSTRKKGNYNKPVFQARDWSKFVRYAGLQVGDRVVLQENDEAQFREIRYRIIAQRIGGDGLWANVEPPERAVPKLIRLF